MTDVKTEEPPKKKSYVKRKNEILKDIEEKKEVVEEKLPVPEEKEESEPPMKKTRITKDDDGTTTETPTPSWLRGAVVKPLLLALVASLSFWVNNFYQTHHQTPVVKKNSYEIKKTVQSVQRPLPVFENNPHRRILVPGFTTN